MIQIIESQYILKGRLLQSEELITIKCQGRSFIFSISRTYTSLKCLPCNTWFRLSLAINTELLYGTPQIWGEKSGWYSGKAACWVVSPEVPFRNDTNPDPVLQLMWHWRLVKLKRQLCLLPYQHNPPPHPFYVYYIYIKFFSKVR